MRGQAMKRAWRLPRRPPLSAPLLICTLLSVSCDRAPAPQTPARAEPPNVLAVAYPMADVVRRGGGDPVHVDWLIESGQQSDSYEPDTEAKNRIRTADLVITGGFNEPWAVEGFDDPSRGRRVIRLDLLQTARESHGAVAQLWLDPLIVRESVGVLADRLRSLRPSGESVFLRNAKDMTSKIDAMLADYRPQLDALSGQKVITLSPAFSALTARFGIVEVRPVEASPLKLTDLDIARLRQAARQENVRVMLVDDDD